MSPDQKTLDLFAKNLKKNLDKTTAYGVGRRLNLAKPTIYSYTSGRSFPSVSVLVAICKELEITPNDLLGF